MSFQQERDDVVNVRARARAIGRELRRRAQDIVEQPIPEDMMDLLRQIDAKQAKKVEAVA